MATRSTCRCGHSRDTHQHFRSGKDCGMCGSRTCRHFRRSGWRPTARAAQYSDVTSVSTDESAA
jgi:hypothetical protein